MARNLIIAAVLFMGTSWAEEVCGDHETCVDVAKDAATAASMLQARSHRRNAVPHKQANATVSKPRCGPVLMEKHIPEALHCLPKGLAEKHLASIRGEDLVLFAEKQSGDYDPYGNSGYVDPYDSMDYSSYTTPLPTPAPPPPAPTPAPVYEKNPATPAPATPAPAAPATPAPAAPATPAPATSAPATPATSEPEPAPEPASAPSPSGSGSGCPTTLTQDAKAGDTSIEVADESCFQAGLEYVLDSGSANEERIVVAGFGTVLLQNPLANDHAAGSGFRVTAEGASLDAAGFKDVTSLCCPADMETFFNRLLASMGLQVCSKAHVQGLMHWFTCVPDMDFQYLLDVINNGNPCKYWAPIGSTCPALSSECEGKWCR